MPEHPHERHHPGSTKGGAVTPYYSDATTTIYHGDCREIVPALNVRADLILTDPPYGDTSLDWDGWPAGWVGAVASSAPQMWSFGSMRMWLGRAPEMFEWWSFGQDVVWEKHNGSSFHADRFRRVHETALQWYRGRWDTLTINPQETNDATARTVRRKERPAHMGEIADSTYTSHDGGPRLMRSVLYVRSMHGLAIHPTEKPVGILAPLIAYSTNPGDLILDPFAGSCSTARAARSLGRRSICIEANEAYLEAAVKALAQGDLFAEATP
jgi:site-specific DNA-methyltransferase (adenine-specific)